MREVQLPPSPTSFTLCSHFRAWKILAGAPQGFYKNGDASSTAERTKQSAESESWGLFRRIMGQTPPIYGTAGLSPQKTWACRCVRTNLTQRRPYYATLGGISRSLTCTLRYKLRTSSGARPTAEAKRRQGDICSIRGEITHSKPACLRPDPSPAPANSRGKHEEPTQQPAAQLSNLHREKASLDHTHLLSGHLKRSTVVH